MKPVCACGCICVRCEKVCVCIHIGESHITVPTCTSIEHLTSHLLPSPVFCSLTPSLIHSPHPSHIHCLTFNLTAFILLESISAIHDSVDFCPPVWNTHVHCITKICDKLNTKYQSMDSLMCIYFAAYAVLRQLTH